MRAPEPERGCRLGPGGSAARRRRGIATHRLSAAGAADPALAWRRYVEIGAWPGWSPHIVGVDADADRIAPGVSGRVHVLGGLRVPFTVTAVDAQERTWSWVVRLGPVPLTLDHAVSTHRRGSSTMLTMEGPAPVVLGYVPLAWVALRRLVAR
jgi:hypothetical protein